MDDLTAKVASLDRQAEALWLMLDKMADTLTVATTRALALQLLLAERGVLDEGAVRDRMRKLQEMAATETELDQSPEAKAWRALRRAIEGSPPPPDDRR